MSQCPTAALAASSFTACPPSQLGKDFVHTVKGLNGSFRLGHAEVVRTGEEVAIVRAGSIALEAATAADHLAKVGSRCSVHIVSTIRRVPVEDLALPLASFGTVATVEGHDRTGSQPGAIN